MAESNSDDFSLDSAFEENVKLDRNVKSKPAAEIEAGIDNPIQHTQQLDSDSFDLNLDLSFNERIPSTSFVVNIQKTTAPECQYSSGDTIGRYQVMSELGTGGFGHVLLCTDPQLRRQVAIKIPRADRIKCADESFLEEGRAVARLDHNSIVRVFNMEETEEGVPFAVMEYVEGPTLRELIQEKGITFSYSIGILIQIADALKYAHGKTIIHRDLKPANVIIANESQQAKLMDFGMALHDLTPEESLTSLAEGTPPYMAPEQIRGENHRLDRRTDIWGFGALMYVMLTGQRPFFGKDTYELLQKICLSDPLPPSRVNPDVPAELERICLKCLEKLMNSRYQSALELEEDLISFREYWSVKIESSPDHDSTGVLPSLMRSFGSAKAKSTDRISNALEVTAEHPVKVVPKGLRSFDSQDAEFFLDLLPGPKDRFGVPDSLRFWLNKFSTEPNDPLTVGLIFGPSGCGKSSFVKAGLLPRLPDTFKTVYLEATPTETDSTLLAKIAELAPDVVADEPSLPVALARIRRGHLIKGHRLLIVIDQFEQWLQSNNELGHQPLIEALRHCDGQQLSCILLVRDDFWMSATRFMSQLDLNVQEGVNSLGIPLFDRRHARKVLTAYGRASEAISGDATADQKKFVGSAIDELAENGEIIPIHLSLFSQMMDSDSWQSAKLRKMGGWQGIGVQFLDKMFSDKRVSRQSDTCREILKMLLPQPTSEIKGAQKSLGEIAAATGYEKKPEQLQSLMTLLDREMRIITTTEHEADEDNQAHYQLTHDFLVNPIRKWITQKEKQTWQGRAGIRLDELSHQWQMQQQNKRYMPGIVEYISMFFGVERNSCNTHERSFLKQANRYYGIRAATLLGVLICMVFLSRYAWRQTQAGLVREKAEMILTASAPEVGARLEALENYDRQVVDKFIESKLANPAPDRATLHALFAKSRNCSAKEFPLTQLLDSIRWADGNECGNILDAFGRLKDSSRESELHEEIKIRFEQEEHLDTRIRYAIVELFLNDSSSADKVLKFDSDPELRERFIDLFPEWHGKLSEVIAFIQEIENPATLSGLIKSLGQMTEELDENQRRKLIQFATNKIPQATQPAVFSSLQWLLQKMGISLPTNLVKASNESWMIKRYLNGESDLVFLRVDSQRVPGLKKGLPKDAFERMSDKPGWRADDEYLEQGFYMASSEVPSSLFYAFINSLEKNDRTRYYFKTEFSELQNLPHERLPIYKVDWYEACRFCNWLSEREGRKPYYAVDEIELSPEIAYPTWKIVPEANGYRLPTMLQWDAANRANTESRFCFGSTSARIHRYAITCFHPFKFDNIFVGASRQKMPNDFGFFDLMGNASEWCVDSPNDHYSQRALRGADAANSGLFWFNSGVVFNCELYVRNASGIRLVLPID